MDKKRDPEKILQEIKEQEEELEETDIKRRGKTEDIFRLRAVWVRRTPCAGYRRRGKSGGSGCCGRLYRAACQTGYHSAF